MRLATVSRFMAVAIYLKTADTGLAEVQVEAQTRIAILPNNTFRSSESSNVGGFVAYGWGIGARWIDPELFPKIVPEGFTGFFGLALQTTAIQPQQRLIGCAAKCKITNVDAMRINSLMARFGIEQRFAGSKSVALAVSAGPSTIVDYSEVLHYGETASQQQLRLDHQPVMGAEEDFQLHFSSALPASLWRVTVGLDLEHNQYAIATVNSVSGERSSNHDFGFSHVFYFVGVAKTFDASSVSDNPEK